MSLYPKHYFNFINNVFVASDGYAILTLIDEYPIVTSLFEDQKEFMWTTKEKI